ncbi:uncharacterized protein LOC114533433 [Dendronephthya gigantea]|uniref:uncharacterized protein LOC114533433 n=1 Tax=Dendronephthya gigantea TaxID=151771 RepID=UPI00106AA8EC|nr:uncharacterized protein LOC114533433 [Dendronephthya gigantea]
MRDSGGSLTPEDIISTHSVDSEAECSLKCLESQVCVGYNYKPGSEKYEMNCQISDNKIHTEMEFVGNREWMFYQDMDTLPQQCHRLNDGWTLIARFSNRDHKHWVRQSDYWYDKVTPYGYVNDPMNNQDMIARGFWITKGKEIKITRSDDCSNTALLQTTSNCLQGQTFRSKITSYGNFRNHKVWASNKCLGRCPVIYGGQYKTTAGFEQHNCSSNIQNSSYIGFWCDWDHGDGAVMMIGGGGRNCSRADHGIAITESDDAKFESRFVAYDFGSDAIRIPPSIYALNLWVR